MVNYPFFSWKTHFHASQSQNIEYIGLDCLYVLPVSQVLTAYLFDANTFVLSVLACVENICISWLHTQQAFY